jgi:RimJ/RimL family protein N-acetyltransferase
MNPDARTVTDLKGKLIRLRPFAPPDVDAAWRGLAGVDESAHPRLSPGERRPQPSETFRRRLQRSGRLWRGCLDLAIDRNGRLIGEIQARTRPRQTVPPGVFEIGVVLYQQRDRGKRFGREAVELLTDWLFEHGGAARVQAGTNAGNAAMRTVLERLGFRLEGILREFGEVGDGRRVDGALYAMTKRDRSAGGTGSWPVTVERLRSSDGPRSSRR